MTEDLSDCQSVAAAPVSSLVTRIPQKDNSASSSQLFSRIGGNWKYRTLLLGKQSRLMLILSATTYSDDTSANPVVGFILIGFILFAYFVPSIIAMMRHHDNTVAIFFLNLLLGWSVIGWICAFIWSLTSRARPQQIIIQNTQLGQHYQSALPTYAPPIGIEPTSLPAQPVHIPISHHERPVLPPNR